MTGPASAVDEAAAHAIWTNALDTGGEVGDDIAFSAAGGHSLAAARLAADARRLLRREIPLARLLSADPTRAEFARLLTDCPVTDERVATAVGAQSGPAATDDSVALPASVRAVWTFHRLHPDTPAYNVVRVLAIDGRVGPYRLRQALAACSDRHEALRAHVIEAAPGEPRLHLLRRPTVPLRTAVLPQVTGGCEDPETAAPPEVRRALREVADQVIPMTGGPLWRAGLVYAPRLRRSWFVLSMHHLVSDLRASDVVLADLARLLGAGSDAQPLPAAPSLRAAMAAETARGDTPRRAEDLRWWAARLAGTAPERTLPLAVTPRPETFAADVATVLLPPQLVDGIDRFARANRNTPAIVLLTAAAALLRSWTGSTVIPGVVSARPGRPEDDGVVAFQLDTLLLTDSTDDPDDTDSTDDPGDTGDGDTFDAACAATRAAYIEAVAHAEPTIGDILDHVRTVRTGARTPFVDLWFNDLGEASAPDRFGALPAVEYDLEPGWALFDLGCYLRRVAAGYRLHVVTTAGLLPGLGVAFAEQLRGVLERAIAAPGSLLTELVIAPEPTPEPAPPAAERLPPAVEPPPELGTGALTMGGSITVHARTAPHRVLISDGAGVLDLGSVAAELATRAAAANGPLVTEAARTREFVLDVLAASASGRGVVLIDAAWPPERRDRAAQTGRGLVTPNSVVQFTSGTTGTPRAVRVSADVRDGALARVARLAGVRSDDRVAMISAPSADPMWRELGFAAHGGGCLCIPPDGVLGDPGALGDWIAGERITIVCATPVLLDLVAQLRTEPLPDLRLVVSGGAALSRTVAQRLRVLAPAATLVNGYGCTETPQLAAALVVPDDEALPPYAELPIGTGLDAVVRRRDGRPCGVGQLGTVWVGEPLLAETADPDEPRLSWRDRQGRRWYDTGDLARRDAAGQLHLAGRTDRQVSVQGIRVQLEEIEQVARAHPDVRDALATMVDLGESRSVLTLAVVAAAGTVTADELRPWLRARLAPAAVPPSVELVPALEVSARHKAIAPATALATPGTKQPPPGALATRLGEVAEQVLGHRIDPATNFFDAGFVSLTLLQFSAALTPELGREVPAIEVFGNPTLNRLTRHLAGAETPGARPVPAPPAAQPGRTPGDRRAARRRLRADIRAHLSGPD